MTETEREAGPSSPGPASRVCSKCGERPRAPRGSWCRECRREAQRAYNERVRGKAEVKTAQCEICGATLEWVAGRGPDRKYCPGKCKRAADAAVQTERRRMKVDPAVKREREERSGLYQQGLRRCNGRCGQIRSLDDFHRRGNGWQYRCKDCTRLDGEEFSSDARVRSWRSHLKRKFNITPEDFAELLIEQQGRCVLCLVPMKQPCIDHDHACCPGRGSCGSCIRGLLCDPCNTRLHNGVDLAWFLRAIEYLGLDGGPMVQGS